ncbi:MAG: hypothetical protein U9N53_08735 [Bacteroidota bacterium]|nr:hypothetical protein [Bacteroidota bacterium]
MNVENKILLSDDKFADLCRLEIEALHRFIEAWMNASIEKTDTIFERFSNALDPDFIIIDPNGESKTKKEITESFWNAYGIRPKSFRISIKNFNPRIASNNYFMATYEEWQSGEKESGRLSTIVFKMSTLNNAISWFHLHETWITDF